MDWSDLQFFLAVARHGSLSAAARQLGVNHSTVLRRLQHFEQGLGVAVLQRQSGGYVLTPAGDELVARLGGLDEQISGAERQVRGLEQQIRGSIRLTSTDTLFASLLTPLLADFQRLHSAVSLQLVSRNEFLRLTPREADMAVRGTHEPPEHLLGRCAGRIQTALYGSRDYLARMGERPLSEHLWVGLDESLAHLKQAAWLSEHVPAEQVVARSDSLVGMLQCVRQGMGLGLLLCPLAEGCAELVRLAEPRPELDTPIWILTHPDLRRVGRIRALSDFLYERLSGDPRLAH